MNPSLVHSIKAAFNHWFIPSLVQSFIGGLHHCTIHPIVHCIIGCFIHCMKAPFTQTIIHPLHQSYNIKRCNHLKQHCIKDVFHHSCIISKQYSIKAANHHSCIAANHRFHRQFSSVSEKFANFVSATSSVFSHAVSPSTARIDISNDSCFIVVIEFNVVLGLFPSY